MDVLGGAADVPLPRQGDVLSAAQRLLPSGRAPAALGTLTALAARLLSTDDAPVSVQVSLLTDVQTVPAGAGLADGVVGASSPLHESLCSVTVATGGTLTLDRAASDGRVADLPLVSSGQVGAYLGVPLVSREGSLVGALCAFCGPPRQWTAPEVALLEELAGAVTAQLELEALAAEHESSRVRWEVAVDAAGVGSFSWDLATGRVDGDERLQALFGYGPGEYPPHVDTAFERVHRDDLGALEAALGAAAASCGDLRAEYRVVLPDGQVRWVSARGRALAGPDGVADRLVGTVQDVTEVRTARDAAARLVETMVTGFVALDRDWRITYLNAEGARVVGQRPDQLVGREFWEAFPGVRESEFGARYEHAMETGEAVEVEAYYDHLSGWFEVRAVPLADGLSLYFLEVSSRHAGEEQARAAAARLELLSSVGAELAATGLDVDGAVAGLARIVTPELADWCLVSLVDERGIRDVGQWHSDPALASVLALYVQERLKDRTDLGAVQRARDTGEVVVVPSGVTEQVLPSLGTVLAREAWLGLATESVAVLPLLARGRITGLLTLCRGVGRPPLSEEELGTAREVATRAALALDNARLYTEQRGLAEGLQRSLLTTPPEPDHCEIAVRYAPAARVASVGGDWYDAFLQPDGATVLVIGDVVGHDTAAAAAMGQLRGILRGIAWDSGADPARVLTALDSAMQGLELDTTATAVVARLEQDARQVAAGTTTLRWSNAGHPPPLLLHPDRTVSVLSDGDADLLLGIDPRTLRRDQAREVDRGSTVLLFTDGLIERREQDLDVGLALLAEALTELGGLPLQELCDALLARLLPTDAEDDVALVAVRLHPEGRPRPVEAGRRHVPPLPDERTGS